MTEGDRLSLRRLVSNLVDNALKYGDQARRRLGTAPDNFSDYEVTRNAPFG